MRSSLVAFLGVLIVAADLEFPASARPADSPQAVDASSRMGDPAVLTGTGQGGAFGRLVDAIDGADVASGPLPAPGFTGGVRVAVGDVNGDGVEDYIVGAGPGGGQVRVYSGVDVALLLTFAPFGDQFADGVYVAAGDINGDGRAEIVVGGGRGGVVAVFSAADGREIGRAFPFTPAYQDGVTVAAGDIDGDGRADVLAGQTVGGLVAVLSGADGHTVASGFPYGPAFAGGVNLAAGDVNGDGRIDIITAPHAGGNLVRVFSGVDLAVIASITPFADAGGVTVAAADVDRDGRADIITGAAAGTPLVRIFSGADQRELNRFLAFDSGSGGGVFVASTSRLVVVGPPRFASGASASFTVGTFGSFSIRAMASPAAAIALSGALPAGLSFSAGFGEASISGTPTGAGVTAVTLTAANAVGVATQTLTITIDGTAAATPALSTSTSGPASNGPVVFTSARTATFPIGAVRSFTVTSAGVAPGTLITLQGRLPVGLRFVSRPDGTATLAGTALPGSRGTYPLVLAASNASGIVTASFTLTVTGVSGAAPGISSANEEVFVVGVADTFTTTTTGTPPPQIALEGTLPAGVGFTDNGDGTGTIGGTASAGTAGVYAATITATNPIGTATQAFTLTIDAPPTAPTFTSAPSSTFTIGAAGSFRITTEGVPRPTEISLEGLLPPGIIFVDGHDGTATLSGTPPPGAAGEFDLGFTAANGVGEPVTQAFTLSVQQIPAFTSTASATLTSGAPSAFTVRANGAPTPALSVAGTLPAGVAFTDNEDGTATLGGAVPSGSGGTFPLVVTAVNGLAPAVTQALTLTVTDAGIFTSPTTTTFTVGVAGRFSITTRSFPAATAVVRGGAALPAGITFTDNLDGTATLSGTPAAGAGGPYTLTFAIDNGVGSVLQQTFTLNVREAPRISSAGSATFVVGAAASFAVTATGFPAPTAAVTTGTLPAGITLAAATLVLDGTATQTGAFTVGLTVSNGVAPDAHQTLTLTVTCPAITIAPASLHEGRYQTSYAPVGFTASGGAGTSFTWSAGGLTAGLAIDPRTGVVSGTPANTILNGPVAISATDNLGCAAATFNTTLTVRPASVNDVYNGAVGNTQLVVGAAGPATPHVLINDNVKNGDNGPGALSATFPPASAHGVVVEGAIDGTFVYTPDVGFAGPSDTFTYTLTDGNGVTNTATVTINLSNVVWYVNSANPISGDGRSNSPFNTLTSAGAASSSAQTIYVHTGGPTTAGSLTLDPDQTLQGQGGVFTIGGLLIPAGARPTLVGTVTLANNTLVRDVNFSGAAPALAAAATTMTLPSVVERVDVSGGTSALMLTNVSATGSGALTIRNVNVANTGSAAVLIAQGNIPVTFAATSLSSASRSVDIRGRTGGTVTFGGPIVDTGLGVFLDANAGTIAFDGGLSLSTGAHTAFTATNGGTIAISAGAVNTITTDGAPALVVDGIGGDQTWRSISAINAATGISVRHLGGSFTVTGVDGGDADTDADAGTGGTISEITARGAEFIDVSGAISLNGMTFRNAGTTNGAPAAACGVPQTGTPELCNAAIHLQSASGGVSLVTIDADTGAQLGINGIDVVNLVMRNIRVANFGDELNEHAVQLKNLTGTGSLSGGVFHDNAGREFYVSNSTGTLTSFAISSSTFDGNDPGRNLMDGVQIDTRGAGTVATVTIDSSTISDNSSNGFDALASAGSRLTVALTNSTLIDNNRAVAVQAFSGADITVTASGNHTLTGPRSLNRAMYFNTLGNSTMTGTIWGNVLGDGSAGSGAACTACDGLSIEAFEGGFMSMDIRGNTIQHVGEDAIRVEVADQSSGGLWARGDFTISGNLIREPDADSDSALLLESGSLADRGAANCLWASLGGPVPWPGSPSVADGVQNRIEGDWEASNARQGREILLQRDNTFGDGNMFRVLGLPADPSQADAFIGANNVITSVSGTNVFLENFPSPNFSAGTTCRF